MPDKSSNAMLRALLNTMADASPYARERIALEAVKANAVMARQRDLEAERQKEAELQRMRTLVEEAERQRERERASLNYLNPYWNWDIYPQYGSPSNGMIPRSGRIPQLQESLKPAERERIEVVTTGKRNIILDGDI